MPNANGTPNDLMLMLSHNRIGDLIQGMEDRVAVLIADRHNYPMWPIHGDPPVDEYEESFHGPMRKVYYMATLEVVRALRALRTIR